MPKKINPQDILPGDYIHLDVPPNRLIETGLHKAVVLYVDPNPRRFERSYTLRLLIDGVDFEDDAVTVTIRFSTTKTLQLAGHGFLGMDKWPVRFTHEQNIERRLSMSLAALKKERPRGVR